MSQTYDVELIDANYRHVWVTLQAPSAEAACETAHKLIAVLAQQYLAESILTKGS